MSESEERFNVVLKDDWFSFKIVIWAWAKHKNVVGLLDGVTPPYNNTPDTTTESSAAASGSSGSGSSSSTSSTSVSAATYEAKKNMVWFQFVKALSGNHIDLLRAVPDGDTVALWKRLLNDFEPKSTASLQQALKGLLAAEQGMASVNEYLDTLNITRTMLKTAIMERKIDLLEVIMQLVTVQGLSSRYEALKQNLFVRGDDIPYAELCETIKLNCQRIDITAGLVPGISPLYALRPSGGKPECPFCKGKGTVKYHELKDCWAKYPHLRPPSRTPVVAAPSGDRAKDPNSKRSLKAARKAAAANEKASKQMHSDEERNSWHTHAEHDKPDDSDLHALRKQSPPTQTIEFEVDSGSECNYMPTSEHLENYRTANHGGHTIVCATGSRNPTEGAGSIGEVLPKVFVNSKIVNPIMAVIAQYNAGRATLFHPKYGVVIAAADDMVVSYTNPIATGGVRNGAFKVDIPITPRMPQATKIQFVKATARERLEGKCNLQLGRFGFAGPARIAALAKDPAYKLDLPAKVPIDAFKIQENDVYQLAKSREKPHRNLGMKITAKKPFEMVHIDCITEPVVGYGGVKYTLVATCDYSAWTYAVNLVSRADVPKALQTWIKTFVEPLHFKVDRIRMVVDLVGRWVGR